MIPAIRGARFPPISPAEVAAALLDAALEPSSGPRHRVVTTWGPEVASIRELALDWKEATGSPGRVVLLPLPGPMGKNLRAA